jgi:SWI/SNF-related matrix-associated actin-dependent regulator 1 of chromatin subfamily A
MTSTLPLAALPVPSPPASPAGGVGAALRVRWRWLVAAPLCALLGTWAATVGHPQQHAAQAQLVLGLGATAPGAAAAATRARATAASDRLLATQISVLRSPRVGRAAALALARHPDAELRAIAVAEQEAAGGIDAWATQVWPRRLTLTRSAPSRVLGIRAQAAHPRYAAALANEAARSLLDTLWQLQAEPARIRATALQAQTEAAAERLTQARQAAARHEAPADWPGPGAVPPDWAAAEAASPQVLLLRTELSSLHAPGRAAAERELQREASALAALDSRWGEAHPQRQAALVRREHAAETLHRQAAAHQAAAAVDAAVLAATQQHQARAWQAHRAHAAASASPLSRTHPAQRGAVQAEAAHRELHQQAQAAELAALAPLQGARWLALAEAPERAASGLPAMALSLVAGTLVGLSAVLLLETHARRVRTRRDLCQTLGLPLLGVLVGPQAPLDPRTAWRGVP